MLFSDNEIQLGLHKHSNKLVKLNSFSMNDMAKALQIPAVNEF